MASFLVQGHWRSIRSVLSRSLALAGHANSFSTSIRKVRPASSLAGNDGSKSTHFGFETVAKHEKEHKGLFARIRALNESFKTNVPLALQLVQSSLLSLPRTIR